METSNAAATAPPSSSTTAPLVTLNDLLWLLYLYPVRWLAIFLPRWLLYGLGKLSNPIVQFQSRGSRARAASWIAQVCRTTPANARRIASQSLSNTMYRTLDALLLLRQSADKMLCCTGIDGLQHLEEAMDRGKGVIIFTGHFCANRLAVRYLAANGYPALSVHNRSPTNRAAGRFGKRFMEPRAAELQARANHDQVYVNDPDCSLRIMRTLRAGGLVFLQIDGRGGTTAIEGPFLGLPWRCRSGMFEVIRFSGCAAVPIVCVGRSSGFRIRFDPMLEIESAPSREAFLSANLPHFFSVVEKQVLENPAEWRLWNNF
jgi:KDO2-lipid IV(A) lauroyltransferase